MSRYGEGFRGDDRKLTTSTGISINDIALNLMKQDPSLSFKEATKKAKPEHKERVEKKKNVEKASDVLEHGGGPVKRKIFKTLFGENVGAMLAKVTTTDSAREKAANTLIQHQPLKNFEKIQTDKLDTILKAVQNVSGEIKEIKAARVAPPPSVTPTSAPSASIEPNTAPPAPPVPPVPKAINLKGVKEALKALGNKSSTIMEALKDMPPNLTEEEMIRYAMMNQQNRQAFMAKRVPVAQVPSAVTEAKSQITTLPPTAPVAVAPTTPVAAPPTPVAVAPTTPAVDNVVDDKSQADVKVLKTEEDTAADRKKKDEANEKILSELNNIEKKLTTNGLTGLISGLLGGLLSGLPSMIWGFLKRTLIGIPRMLLGMIKKAFSGLGEKALKFLGLDELGADIGAGVTGVASTVLGAASGIGAVGTMAYGLYRNLSGKDQKQMVEGTESRLGKYGIKPILKTGQGGIPVATGYDIKGKQYGLSDLPPEYKTIVDAYGVENDRSFTARQAQAEINAHPEKYKALEVTTPNVKPTPSLAPDTSDKISKVDDTSDKDQQQTVVNNDNRQFITQPPNNNDEKPIVIQVRNSESSVSSYTASIFDHPVVAPGLYGM